VVTLPPEVRRIGPHGITREFVYRAHPDYRHRIANHVKAQEGRLRGTLNRLRGAEAPTYPTGDPTHFDVDWLGRVVYRGPVPSRSDAAWPDDDASVSFDA
jgi:hypothetical protein